MAQGSVRGTDPIVGNGGPNLDASKFAPRHITLFKFITMSILNVRNILHNIVSPTTSRKHGKKEPQSISHCGSFDHYFPCYFCDLLILIFRSLSVEFSTTSTFMYECPKHSILVVS